MRLCGGKNHVRCQIPVRRSGSETLLTISAYLLTLSVPVMTVFIIDTAVR